jgi:hypothetical protein
MNLREVGCEDMKMDRWLSESLRIVLFRSGDEYWIPTISRGSLWAIVPLCLFVKNLETGNMQSNANLIEYAFDFAYTWRYMRLRSDDFSWRNCFDFTISNTEISLHMQKQQN